VTRRCAARFASRPQSRWPLLVLRCARHAMHTASPQRRCCCAQIHLDAELLRLLPEHAGQAAAVCVALGVRQVEELLLAPLEVLAGGFGPLIGAVAAHVSNVIVVMLGDSDGASDQCDAAVLTAGAAFDFPPKQPVPSVTVLPSRSCQVHVELALSSATVDLASMICTVSDELVEPFMADCVYCLWRGNPQESEPTDPALFKSIDLRVSPIRMLLTPENLLRLAQACATVCAGRPAMAAASPLHSSVGLRCHEYASEAVVSGLEPADGWTGAAGRRAFWSEMARLGVSESRLRDGSFGEGRRTSAELQAAMVAHFLHYEWARLRWDELVRPVLEGA
jgi:hypothetical protein